MKKNSRNLAVVYASSAFFLAFLSAVYGFAVPALVSADDTLLCIAGGVLAVAVGPLAGAFWLADIISRWRKIKL